MFGLDVKSLVVGMLLAYFVLPWIMAFVSRSMAPKASTATI